MKNNDDDLKPNAETYKALMDESFTDLELIGDEDENGDVKTIRFIDENYTTGSVFHRIENFVSMIDEGKQVTWKEFDRMLDTECHTIEMDLKTSVAYTRGRHYMLSEYISVFMSALEELRNEKEFTEHLLVALNKEIAGEKSLREECFELLVLKIQVRLKSSALRRKRCLRRYNAQRNFESVRHYIGSLFERHSKLMVLRLDLAIDSDYHHQIELETMKDYLNTLLNNKRNNKLFKHQVGYIWKLEYGHRKGYHYHVMLFFDGSKVQKDVFYAREIGEYWVKTITNGMGVYFNCNYKKKYYRSLGIGTIHYKDKELRENLLKAAKYMCKKEQYLLLTTGDKMRTLGKGRTSEADSFTKKGRARLLVE